MISSKQKIHIIILLIFIVFIAIIIAGIIPLFNKTRQASQNFSNQKAVLGSINSRIDEVKSFQEERSLLKQNLNRVESAFIEADSPVEFLDYLDKAAQNTNLLMTVYPTKNAPELDDIWLSINFRITVGGDINDCLKFLEMIEQSKWMFEILQFTLQEAPEKNSYPKEFESLNLGDGYMSIVLKAYSGELNAPKQN